VERYQLNSRDNIAQTANNREKCRNPQHYLLGPMTHAHNKTCYTPLKIDLNAMSKIGRILVP